MQELAPTPPRVGPVLQYLWDWPTTPFLGFVKTQKKNPTTESMHYLSVQPQTNTYVDLSQILWSSIYTNDTQAINESEHVQYGLVLLKKNINCHDCHNI